MLAYSGWNASAYVAEEISDPGRNLPQSLAIGTIAVIAVYLGVILLYLYVFSVPDLAALKGSVLDVVAERLLGSGAGHVMGMVWIVSLLAGNSAMTFAGPRVYFAMARDDVFFKAASKSSTYRTPAFAIVAQTMWAALFILTGSGNALITYTGFSITLFLGIAVFALFVLRWRSRTRSGRSRRSAIRSRRPSSRSPAFHPGQRALYRSRHTPRQRAAGRPFGGGASGHRPRPADLLLLRAPPNGVDGVPIVPVVPVVPTASFCCGSTVPRSNEELPERRQNDAVGTCGTVWNSWNRGS